MIATFPVYLIDREKVSFIPDLSGKEYQLASIEDLDVYDLTDRDLLQGDKLKLLEGIFTINYQAIASGKRELYLTPYGDCTV